MKNTVEGSRTREFSSIPNVLRLKLQHVGESLFAESNKNQDLRAASKEIEYRITGLSNPTIYIHIPFCRTHCNFCDFPTSIFQQVIATRYIQALDLQLGWLQEQYPQLDMSKVYIGGGTPATVLPELLTLIHKYRLGSNELSLEAHPQDFSHITSDELAQMTQVVKRVSIGVQTFDEDLLKKMDRSNGQNPIENIAKAVESDMQVNVDLIYGLEGQSVESFIHDLKKLIAFRVPQITCYPLMGRDTKNRQLVEDDIFYKAMLETFKSHGYTPLTPWCFTTLDNSAQGEYISHNDNDSREQILALGIGGISKLGNMFAINHFNLGAFFESAQNNQMPLMKTRHLSQFEEAQYFLLTALFGMKINTKRLTGNRKIDALIEAELLVLLALGVVKKAAHVASDTKSTEYVLTEQGMFYMSGAMASFYAGLGHFRKPHNKTIENV